MQSVKQRFSQKNAFSHPQRFECQTYAATLLHSQPAVRKRPAVQTVGSLIGAHNISGMNTISSIEQTNTGAVVLQALREDGLMTSAALTQLPSWAADASIALLNSQDDKLDNKQDVVRLVLNQPGENFQQYTINMDSPARCAELPVILERKSETLPVFYGPGAYINQTGFKFTGEVRKRLCLDDEGTRKKIKQ